MVAEVWTAAGALGWPFGPLIQLLLLTAQRRDEVASMACSELPRRASADLVFTTTGRTAV